MLDLDRIYTLRAKKMFGALGLDGPAAVHHVAGAGDHGGIARCQEDHHLGNLPPSKQSVLTTHNRNTLRG